MVRSLTAVILAGALTLGLDGCAAARNLDKPRPIRFRCTKTTETFITTAAEVFQRNGYAVTLRDIKGGRLEARDSVENVRYPYAALIREWTVLHANDTAVIHVRSVNTRLDDSEVAQTWDKRRGDEIVKDWMRPILTSLESTCGQSSPLSPAR